MYRCEFIFVVADAINQWTRINKITVEGEFVGLRCHAVNFEVEKQNLKHEIKNSTASFLSFFKCTRKIQNQSTQQLYIFRDFFSHSRRSLRGSFPSTRPKPKRKRQLDQAFDFFSFYTFFFFFFKLVYYLAYSLTVNNKKNSSGKESQPRKRKTKIN